MIAVYGARSNVGVTTIASSLAAAFVTLGLGRVALAEFNPRSGRARGDQTRATMADTAPTLNGQGNDEPASEQIVIPGTDAALDRRVDGLWVLAPGPRRTMSLSDAKSVSGALDAMRASFAVSVAELEHQVNERTLAAFDAADRIVMVTEGSVPSLRGTQRVLRLFRRLNYPDEKMCVVVNRYDAPGALPVADIATILKREVAWKVGLGESLDASALAERLLSFK